jgi:hypothetical protein
MLIDRENNRLSYHYITLKKGISYPDRIEIILQVHYMSQENQEDFLLTMSKTEQYRLQIVIQIQTFLAVVVLRLLKRKYSMSLQSEINIS